MYDEMVGVILAVGCGVVLATAVVFFIKAMRI